MKQTLVAKTLMAHDGRQFSAGSQVVVADEEQAAALMKSGQAELLERERIPTRRPKAPASEPTTASVTRAKREARAAKKAARTADAAKS